MFQNDEAPEAVTEDEMLYDEMIADAREEAMRETYEELTAEEAANARAEALAGPVAEV